MHLAIAMNLITCISRVCMVPFVGANVCTNDFFKFVQLRIVTLNPIAVK